MNIWDPGNGISPLENGEGGTRLTAVIRYWGREMECCRRKGLSELTEYLEQIFSNIGKNN